MWYDIIPSLVVVAGALSLIEVYIHYSNKFVLGNPYKRWVEKPEEFVYYLRDMRLSGDKNSPYHQIGIDSFPDYNFDNEKPTAKEENK